MDLMTTLPGSNLEGFYPEGWDLQRIDDICGLPLEDFAKAESHWHPEFELQACDDLDSFAVMLGHEIAQEIRAAHENDQELALILPVGPMGMYRWVVYFLKAWGIPADRVTCFNMDEWSDSDGNTLPADDIGSFQYAMEKAFYEPLGDLTVPEDKRNFATRENLPTYAEKIAAIKADGGRLVTVYGIGRMCHVAFWEPQFAGEYESDDDWLSATHRLGAKLHPLTIEQNALTSFKSRSTLVPATANTVGPGLFLKSDRMIGGADGVFGRGMQWQGASLHMTLRYGPDRWVPSSYVPTIPGSLFYMKDLEGPMAPEVN